VQERCGGFFATGRLRQSNSIWPIPGFGTYLMLPEHDERVIVVNLLRGVVPDGFYDHFVSTKYPVRPGHSQPSGVLCGRNVLSCVLRVNFFEQ